MFDGVLLSQIHIGHFLEYQRQRRMEAGASCVNHELNTMAQILKTADLWDLIEKHYKPLPLPNWTPPKVLTAEEEERFFRVVAGNPDWSVAYWAVSLTNNTSAMGIELRHLQMKHVFLEQQPPTIHIPDSKVKNEFRARVVPLNAVAAKQASRIVERAKRLGAWHADHYIFPFRLKRGTYDVARPASPYFIRSAFRTMRKTTGLDWLQPRNFRNQIITKLFESGAPDETIMSIAGHQSIKMSRYYSRIRITAKAEALNAICPGVRS
jgi:site-specific recombinase XerD